MVSMEFKIINCSISLLLSCQLNIKYDIIEVQMKNTIYPPTPFPFLLSKKQDLVRF